MSEECYTMKDGTFIPMCMGAAARGKDYCTCKTMTKAELRRDRERKTQCIQSLHLILKERNCCTPDDYWDINQMVIAAIRHSQENGEGEG